MVPFSYDLPTNSFQMSQPVKENFPVQFTYTRVIVTASVGFVGILAGALYYSIISFCTEYMKTYKKQIR
jgi:hypothetical protein